MGVVVYWTVAIVGSVGTAAFVAAWRPWLAVALAPIAALGFVVSFDFSVSRWEECNPCPRVEHVFEWINAILAVLAPSLLVVGVSVFVVKRLQRH